MKVLVAGSTSYLLGTHTLDEQFRELSRSLEDRQRRALQKEATMMERLIRIGIVCAAIAMGWLLGACAQTPTAPAVDPSPIGLSATLEAPSSLPNGEAVPVTFTLTNHSPGRLYILTWYSPLEGIFGEIFRVARDGQAIAYEGPLVMRGDPLPEDYVLLEPGASVSAEVDLAEAYDFSQAGEYTIQFLSPRISQVAKTDSEFAASVDDLGPVEIPCNSLSLEITGSSALRYLDLLGSLATQVDGEQAE